MGIECPRRMIPIEWYHSCLDFGQREINNVNICCGLFKMDYHFRVDEGTNIQTKFKYHALRFSYTTWFGNFPVKGDDSPFKAIIFHILIEPKVLSEDDGHAQIFLRTSKQPSGFSWFHILDRYGSLQPYVQHFKSQACSVCKKIQNDKTILILPKWLSVCYKLPLNLSCKNGVWENLTRS